MFGFLSVVFTNHNSLKNTAYYCILHICIYFDKVQNLLRIEINFFLKKGHKIIFCQVENSKINCIGTK